MYNFQKELLKFLVQGKSDEMLAIQSVLSALREFVTMHMLHLLSISKELIFFKFLLGSAVKKLAKYWWLYKKNRPWLNVWTTMYVCVCMCVSVCMWLCLDIVHQCLYIFIGNMFNNKYNIISVLSRNKNFSYKLIHLTL